jgi:hypothetical protein
MEKIEIGREIGWYGWGRWLEAAMGETGARSSAREEMASEQGGSSLAERVPAWPVGIRESMRRERRLEIRLWEGRCGEDKEKRKADFCSFLDF